MAHKFDSGDNRERKDTKRGRMHRGEKEENDRIGRRWQMPSKSSTLPDTRYKNDSYHSEKFQLGNY